MQVQKSKKYQRSTPKLGAFGCSLNAESKINQQYVKI